MKRHSLPVTVLAGALLPGLAPPDAVAQWRAGGLVHGGGRPVVVVGHDYGPSDVGDRLIGGADLLGVDLRGISGSVALPSGGR